MIAEKLSEWKEHILHFPSELQARIQKVKDVMQGDSTDDQSDQRIKRVSIFKMI